VIYFIGGIVLSNKKYAYNKALFRITPGSMARIKL
jgi:hypothetical protein